MKFDVTEEQQLILNVIPRVAAFITLCCSFMIIVTVLRSKYYRRRIYHRIMLGCGVNMVVIALITLWGSAAIPVSTPHVSWARGNTFTCSMSGFLYQFTVFAVPQYYCALSVLSMAAAGNKFSVSKFLWMEKYIHVGVYIFPLCSSLYLLSLDAFNPVIIGCALASEPLGCGDQAPDDEPLSCTRGPENIGQLQWLFWALPCILICIIPTVMMLVIYLKVRKKGPGARAVAVSIGRQALIYLLVLGWTYIFRFIDLILIFKTNSFVFTTNLLANTNEALIGLWMLIAYWYFRSDDQPALQIENETSPTLSIDHNDAEKARERVFDSSHFKPDFSIFDGSDIPNNSPWASFLSEGIDDDYDYEDTITEQ